MANSNLSRSRTGRSRQVARVTPQFSKRVVSTLNDLARDSGMRTVVAVAHGGTVVQSMWGLLEYLARDLARS